MRLTAHGVTKFQHDGLVVGETWSEFDYVRADKQTQEAFRTFVGRFVRIHADDVAELTELGLALERGRIVALGEKRSKGKREASGSQADTRPPAGAAGAAGDAPPAGDAGTAQGSGQ